MRILVTGANGFLAKSLIKMLLNKHNYRIFGTVRSINTNLDSRVNVIVTGDIHGQTNWKTALENIDVVIHTAARAHILRDKASDPMQEFITTNVEGTIALAKEAIFRKVKRFIFISSIGVNGTNTEEGQAFNELSPPNPTANYAKSKYLAEQQLLHISKTSEMQLVVIRPPLVYAEDAPGNFGRLMKIIRRKIPMPFSLIKNRRSFIYRENLSDFICKCIDHPAAANELFLVSDNESLSLAELLTILSKSMNSNAYQLPIPPWIIKGAAHLLRKETLYKQLCSSLVIDSFKARNLLNWTPPYSARDALHTTGKMFINNEPLMED